ncbi:MAG: YtxH domain-containing protein [Prolixibacteraceae bacterium]|nr:YtxH domain-containing protein [Prolixibacteraceae bacterium]MBN2648821.1 YtxH domain-containing protein [Prolixibacteraceae bacterium]
MKNTGLFLTGLLVGAAAGAALGLLYAPQSGKETRKQIGQKIKEMEAELAKLRDKLKEKGVEMKDEIKQKIKELETRIEKMREQYKNAPEEA